MNNFLNVRGSFVSVRGEKRRSSFLTPSLAGASKGSSSRKNFKNLTSNQQFEALHQIANQQVCIHCSNSRTLGNNFTIAISIIDKSYYCKKFDLVGYCAKLRRVERSNKNISNVQLLEKVDWFRK